MKKLKYIVVLQLIAIQFSFAQTNEGNTENLPVKEYTLTIDKKTVNKAAGKDVMGMTINGTIPGPVLEFTEGDYAVIYVKNNMDVETSIHWHGLILPNFYDGVPYLTTPPIRPGETFKYEFTLKQSGTYWYHSHTMLQEQSGVFGSFVIKPKEKILNYSKELVLILSDWTNEKPMNVLRNLKRRNEWYNMKKGTATPLNQVIARGAFGAQLNFWRQRMEGADIADVYYPAFLINGEEEIEYPDFKPGEKVRLRIIDGAASTSFWMTFGGEIPTLIASDGLNVIPIKKNKTFIGVAETYDYIVTIPDNGKLEFKITAQDGSGTASAFLGNGKVLPAMEVPRPDKIGMMQEMAKMDMKMGAHALKFQPKKDERNEMKAEYGMQMDNMSGMGLPAGQVGINKPKDSMEMDKMKDMKMDHSNMQEMQMNQQKDSLQIDHSKMNHSKEDMENPKDTIRHKEMDHSKMNHGKMTMEKPKDTMMHKEMDHSKMNIIDVDMKMKDMQDMDPPAGRAGMFSEYNYDYLKSPHKTSYNKDFPVTDILLNLTGNMNRYIWSINGVPLSEADKIKIKSGEVTRMTFNNLTMMHHPMHLHGHFFRVINKNGEYSPLKHTVNVPPMQEITIEFYGDEYGDWFFHCHILYHMMSGMTRIISYDTPRDERMEKFPITTLIKEDTHLYSWGMLDAASHMTEFNYVVSNIRNQFNASVEYGWNENLEAEITYERYLHDYLRVFGGVNFENEMEDSLDDIETTAVIGIRYLTPYLFNLDVRMDSKLRPQIRLSREINIFPRTAIFGNYEYQADFGWVNDFPLKDNFKKEVTWSVGIEYFLSKNVSLMGSYDNRFGAGGGLSIRF